MLFRLIVGTFHNQIGGCSNASGLDWDKLLSADLKKVQRMMGIGITNSNQHYLRAGKILLSMLKKRSKEAAGSITLFN